MKTSSGSMSFSFVFISSIHCRTDVSHDSIWTCSAPPASSATSVYEQEVYEKCQQAPAEKPLHHHLISSCPHGSQNHREQIQFKSGPTKNIRPYRKKTLVSKKRNFLFQYYCLQLYKIICQLQSFIKQYRCCLATTVSNGVRHLPPYGTRVLYPTDGRTVALLPPFQQSVGASSS